MPVPFLAMLLAVGSLAAEPGPAKPAEKIDPAAPPTLASYEKILKQARIDSDGPSLLAFFRGRTLSDADRAKLVTTIRKLGDPDFDVRERASAELTRAGIAALPILRAAASDGDPEIARRLERCLQEINQESETGRIVAAAHVLADRRPEGAVKALLDYLPCVPDDESVAEGILSALTAMTKATGKADPMVVAALSDRDPARRALAAQVLGAALPEQRPAVRKLLSDADAKVRFLTATTLLKAGDKTALPAMIRMIGEGPIEHAYQAEDVLCQLAGDKDPPATLSSADEANRKKCKEAWEAWWEKNRDTVDLARLNKAEPYRGITMVIEVDSNNGFNGNSGRIWECGPDKKQRWEMTNLGGPVDVQLLPGGRLLIAEYYNVRVTERDRTGKILWDSGRLGSNPVSCQRLPNGNTLIATMNEVVELNREKGRVGTYPRFNGTVYQAIRARNGHTFVLSNNTLTELDMALKQLRQINVGTGSGWAGFEILPNGHFLIAHYVNGGRYAEVDGTGKEVFTHTVGCQPTRVQRLRNGNTLVAGGNTYFVAEYDRDKKEVWRVETKGRPFGVKRY